MTTSEILEELDAHARTFAFPMPDNIYVEEADMRLTAFRGADEWLIVFQEVCVFQEERLLDMISAYGSNVAGGMAASVEDVVSPADVPGVRDVALVVAGRRRRMRPSAAELRDAGIADPDVPPAPIELLRLACVMFPGELFLPEKELPERCGRGGADLRLLLSLDDWRHPDLAHDELPSDSPCLRSLAEALVADDASLYGCPAELHNTHWSNWSRTD